MAAWGVRGARGALVEAAVGDGGDSPGRAPRVPVSAGSGGGCAPLLEAGPGWGSGGTLSGQALARGTSGAPPEA